MNKEDKYLIIENFKKADKKHTNEYLGNVIGLSKDAVRMALKRLSLSDLQLDTLINHINKSNNISQINEQVGSVLPESNASFSSQKEVDVFVNTNGNKYYIYDNGSVEIEVVNIPFPAYASYLEVYMNEQLVLDSFDTTRFKVDKIGKGNYKSFDIKGDSMWNEGGYDTPDGASVLAREIGRHLWNGNFRKEKYGYILLTTKGIYHKDIESYNEQTGELTVSSRNPQCKDFTIQINDVKQIFNVIKRAF